MAGLLELLFFGIIIFLSISAKKKSKSQAESRQAAGYGAAHDRGRVQSTLTQVDPGGSSRSVPALRKQAANASHRAHTLTDRAGQSARHALEDWRRGLSEADGPGRFDRESLNYCDSNLPVTDGISFKELPPGADELEMLIRHNRQREKQLEQALQIRE